MAGHIGGNRIHILSYWKSITDNYYTLRKTRPDIENNDKLWPLWAVVVYNRWCQRSTVPFYVSHWLPKQQRLFLSFAIAGELWRRLGCPAMRTNFLWKRKLPTNCRFQTFSLLSSKVNFMIFITSFTFIKMNNYVLDWRINVLTSYTRDTRL